jgi:1-deoxy-D-xylulose-5-phosphate synthase
VVDPRWVRPVPPVLAQLAAMHKSVYSVEDGVRSGGAGAALARFLADRGVTVPVSVLGLPDGFVPHGSRSDLLRRYGLDPAGIAAAVAAGPPPAPPRASVRNRAAQPVLVGAHNRPWYRR